MFIFRDKEHVVGVMDAVDSLHERCPGYMQAENGSAQSYCTGSNFVTCVEGSSEISQMENSCERNLPLKYRYFYKQSSMYMAVLIRCQISNLILRLHFEQ